MSADEQRQPDEPRAESTQAAATKARGSSQAGLTDSTPPSPGAGTPEALTAPPREATGAAPGARPVISKRRWVWDHIGRISGIVLGLLLTAVLCLLMAAGYSAAGFLLLLVLGGMVMIAVGGRIHGR
ncbi:MAG: hypothetical protein M0014_13955 [Actinomycetota bacterium]|nr:hypothetical protein [Actinomycetota bacterium]